MNNTTITLSGTKLQAIKQVLINANLVNKTSDQYTAQTVVHPNLGGGWITFTATDGVIALVQQLRVNSAEPIGDYHLTASVDGEGEVAFNSTDLLGVLRHYEDISEPTIVFSSNVLSWEIRPPGFRAVGDPYISGSIPNRMELEYRSLDRVLQPTAADAVNYAVLSTQLLSILLKVWGPDRKIDKNPPVKIVLNKSGKAVRIEWMPTDVWRGYAIIMPVRPGTGPMQGYSPDLPFEI